MLTHRNSERTRIQKTIRVHRSRFCVYARLYRRLQTIKTCLSHKKGISASKNEHKVFFLLALVLFYVTRFLLSDRLPFKLLFFPLHSYTRIKTRLSNPRHRVEIEVESSYVYKRVEERRAWKTIFHWKIGDEVIFLDSSLHFLGSLLSIKMSVTSGKKWSYKKWANPKIKLHHS